MALGSSFFFLAAAFARSFSLLQRSRGTAGGRRHRRGPSGVPAAPGPSPPPSPSPSPSRHSHALVPQADHALHHRVLPRLLLLPLQRDAAAVSGARLPGAPGPPHPPLPVPPTSPSRSPLTMPPPPPPPPVVPAPPPSVTASRPAGQGRPRRHFPGRPPGAAGAEPEPSVTALPGGGGASAGRGLRHRGVLPGGVLRWGNQLVGASPGCGGREGAPHRVPPVLPRSARGYGGLLPPSWAGAVR